MGLPIEIEYRAGMQHPLLPEVLPGVNARRKAHGGFDLGQPLHQPPGIFIFVWRIDLDVLTIGIGVIDLFTVEEDGVLLGQRVVDGEERIHLHLRLGVGLVKVPQSEGKFLCTALVGFIVKGGIFPIFFRSFDQQAGNVLGHFGHIGNVVVM